MRIGSVRRDGRRGARVTNRAGLHPTRAPVDPFRLVESLEPRRLLAVTAEAGALPFVERAQDSPPDFIPLHPAFTGYDTFVRLHVSIGDSGDGGGERAIDVQLFDDDPALGGTIGNFLRYAVDGGYNQTIIHRAVPGGVVQGGGFDTGFNHIPEGPPVPDESNPARPNLRGTIATAPPDGGGPATSEFLFNLGDNAAAFDGTGRAVFGAATPAGLATLDEVAGVPAAAFGEPFESLPLVNYAGVPEPIPFESLVRVTSVQELAPFPVDGFDDGSAAVRFSAESSNPGLVVPTVSGGELTLEYAAGQSGGATITVFATDLAGNVAANSFDVSVLSAGEPAPDFGGGDGELDVPFGGQDERLTDVADVAVQPDGKFVVVGYELLGGDNDFSVVRLNEDGTLDTSFGDGDGVVTLNVSVERQNLDDRATAVEIQPDGKILVTGFSSRDLDFDGVSAEGDMILARFNADGTVDRDFGGNDVLFAGREGSPPSSFPNEDGGVGYVRVAFLGFGDINRETRDVANGLTVQPDGRIVVVGTTNANRDEDLALLRFEADGSLDASFNNGTGRQRVFFRDGSNDRGNAVTVDPQGRIVAVGGFVRPAPEPFSGFAVHRFRPDGTRDTSFNRDGSFGVDIDNAGREDAYSVAIQPDDDPDDDVGGKIVIGGTAATFGADSFVSDFALVRVNDDGSLDDNNAGHISDADPATNTEPAGPELADQTPGDGFGTNGTVATDFGAIEGVTTLIALPDGKLIASGKFALDPGDAARPDNTKVVLARYNADGSLDTTFGDGGRVYLFEAAAPPPPPPLSPAGEPGLASAPLSAAAADLAADLADLFEAFLRQNDGAAGNTPGQKISAIAGATDLLRIAQITADGSLEAALAVDDVRRPGDAAVFGLRVRDLFAIDPDSLASDDVLVVRTPSGEELKVTFVELRDALSQVVTLARARGAEELSAKYRLAPPGGAWQVTDNGTYAVRVNPERVRNVTGSFLGAGEQEFVVAVAPSGPVATLVAPARVTADGTTSLGVQVRYDVNGGAVDRSSISADDLEVTAPDGTTLRVELDSATPAGDAASLTASYRVSPPGGRAFAAAASGRYEVALRDGAVRDAAGAGTPPLALGTFRVDIAPATPPPNAAPVPKLDGAPTPEGGGGGGGPRTFRVRYDARQGAIRRASLGDGDVGVIGPDGVVRGVALVSVTPDGGDAPTLTATYRLAPEAGATLPGGEYRVVLRTGEVSDADGRVAPAGTVGKFAVTLSPVDPNGPDFAVVTVDGVKSGGFVAGARGGAARVVVRNLVNPRTANTPVLVRIVLRPQGGGGPDVVVADRNVTIKASKPKKGTTPPNKDATAKFKFNYPAGAPVGSFSVVAIVDPEGGVPEADESNNEAAAAGATVTLDKFDLAGGTGSGPSMPPSKKALLSVPVLNASGLALKAKVVIAVFASGARLDTGKPVSLKLGPNEARSVPVKVNTSLLSPGTYALAIMLDATDALAEKDPDNNVVSGLTLTII